MPLRSRDTLPLVLIVIGIALLIGLGKYLLDAEPRPEGSGAPSAPIQPQEAEVPGVPPVPVAPARTEAEPGAEPVAGAALAGAQSTERGKLQGRVLFAKGRAPAAD